MAGLLLLDGGEGLWQEEDCGMKKDHECGLSRDLLGRSKRSESGGTGGRPSRRPLSEQEEDRDEECLHLQVYDCIGGSSPHTLAWKLSSEASV